jgi:hypothetical protein
LGGVEMPSMDIQGKHKGQRIAAAIDTCRRVKAGEQVGKVVEKIPQGNKDADRARKLRRYPKLSSMASSQNNRSLRQAAQATRDKFHCPVQIGVGRGGGAG